MENLSALSLTDVPILFAGFVAKPLILPNITPIVLPTTFIFFFGSTKISSVSILSGQLYFIFRLNDYSLPRLWYSTTLQNYLYPNINLR